MDSKANPLTWGAAQTLLPQPCALVIFGAAGDLSWRKLLPALYNLNVDGVLPSNFAVVGFGIGAEGDPDEWIRQRAKDGTTRFSRRPPEDSHWADFARSLFYVNGSFNDARAYAQLKARLESIDQQFGIPGSRIYYLAVPPNVVGTCVEHLKSAGMVASPSDTRLIINGNSWLAALPKPQTIRQRTKFVRHNQSAEPLRWDSFLAEERTGDLATDRPRRVRIIS